MARKLLDWVAPGVDEIRLGFLKGLDVVELSWMTCLQHHMDIGDISSGIADWGGGPPLCERGPEGMFQL